jgi:hypothetical protein
MATNTLPLNKFRLLATTLSSGSNLIYSSSLDISTIVLSALITNVSDTIQTASVKVQKSGSLTQTTLVKDSYIPVTEALNPFSGKIVLERYDALYFESPTTGTLEAVLSVLETANN